MPIKFYNTLTRKKEFFDPIKKGEVSIYSCGPTVYNVVHIGNLRAFIFADLLRRYLKYSGYKVKQVRNLTDVDDKTIRDSQEQNVSLKEFTEKYTKLFLEDMKTSNIEDVEVNPKATEHIEEMVELINKLLEKEIAYFSDDGSIYYDVKKFKDYGKLAHIKFENMKAGARVKQDEYEKNQANDFALWKSYEETDGKVFWEPEFIINGKKQVVKGRPGWHIECSAMSTKYLGQPFDIHTGGVDLIFPHHENEIAQSEGAYEKEFAKYWIHNEHLLVNGKKMSKSLGNFFTLRDLTKKGHNPIAVRFVLLSIHYRQQLNFTMESLKAAENVINKLQEFIERLQNLNSNADFNEKIPELLEKAKKDFEKAMDDDLNTPKALAVIHNLTKEVNIMVSKKELSNDNSDEVIQLLKMFNNVLGIFEFKKQRIPKEITELAEKRDLARKEKKFEESDQLRDQIKSKGYAIEDLEDGFRVKKIK